MVTMMTVPTGGSRFCRIVAAATILLGTLILASGEAFAFEFCNTTRIVGTSGTGPANPYPSTINVSGLSGTVTDVNVRLLDVRTRGDNNSPPQHWAEDLDVLVSAPNNANVVLMSDAGGDNDISSGPVVDADLTFDDQALNQLPADSLFTTGTYRPVDDDNDVAEAAPTDSWDLPAPTPSGSTTLSTFNGANPNGTWSLWVVDDIFQAATDINGGWCVDIITTGGRARPVTADFDGNRTTDVSVYRPSTGVWYVQSPFNAVKWGEPGDVPVPGDYDGNGRTEFAVYRPSTGVWYLYGPPFRATKWGETGDVPVPGDYDGDGDTDVAVYRPTTGVWYVQSPFQAVKWGEPNDIPIPGDYDGNGSTEFAVYRPSTGVWYLYGPPFRATKWGETGDIPVPGDYDANGTTDVAVYRPTTGVWYVQSPFNAVKWGEPGDVPVPGDYDGNGRTEFAVYRRSTGVWYLYGPPFRATKWGETGDIPLPLPQAIYRRFF